MKLTIAQIVLEQCEFKHRDDYLSVPSDKPPGEAGLTLSSQVLRAKNAPNEKALVRLHAASDSNATYVFEVTYVVFYGMAWDEGESVPADLEKRLMVTGATMLLPFVRETVASLTSRGKFGPIWVAPTNIADLSANAESDSPRGG